MMDGVISFSNADLSAHLTFFYVDLFNGVP